MGYAQMSVSELVTVVSSGEKQLDELPTAKRDTVRKLLAAKQAEIAAQKEAKEAEEAEDAIKKKAKKKE